MDINELQPIFDLLTSQEERLVRKINEVHEDVKLTKDQAFKTNGRVTQLEKNEIKNELVHVLNCPQAPKIAEINKDLADYRFFLKYPKLVISGIVVAVVVLLVSSNYLLNVKENKQIQTYTQKLESTIDSLRQHR